MSDFTVSCGQPGPGYGNESVVVTVTSTDKEQIQMTYTAQNNGGYADSCTPPGGPCTPQNDQPANVKVEIAPSSTPFAAGYNNGVFTATGTYQGETQTSSTSY